MDVAYSTVTCSLVARFMVTLTVALPPVTFSATLTSPTESDGLSSFVIVTSPVESLMLAFEAFAEGHREHLVGLVSAVVRYRHGEGLRRTLPACERESPARRRVIAPRSRRPVRRRVLRPSPARLVARFMVTLTVALPPVTSSATLTSPTERDGLSSLVIVTNPVESLMLAPEDHAAQRHRERLVIFVSAVVRYRHGEGLR